MSKLIQGYKILIAKNKQSLVNTNLLLLAANFAINNFSDQPSYLQLIKIQK